MISRLHFLAAFGAAMRDLTGLERSEVGASWPCAASASLAHPDGDTHMDETGNREACRDGMKISKQGSSS